MDLITGTQGSSSLAHLIDAGMNDCRLPGSRNRMLSIPRSKNHRSPPSIPAYPGMAAETKPLVKLLKLDTHDAFHK